MGREEKGEERGGKRGEEKRGRGKERRQSMGSWCWQVVPTSGAGTLRDECSHTGGLVGNGVALLDCGKGLQVWALVLKTF